jgi:hypothetical protein
VWKFTVAIEGWTKAHTLALPEQQRRLVIEWTSPL